MIDFKEFCDYALKSSVSDSQFELNLSKHTCTKTLRQIGINIANYKFIIKENAIRHIRNSHPEDIKYLPRIIPTINQCDDVEKSIIQDSQTRQNIINLVFKKRFDDGIMQLVAVRVYKNKALSLKTFFKK